MYNKVYKYIFKNSFSNNKLNIVLKNCYGIKSKINCILTKNQLEMFRQYLTKKIKKSAYFFVKVNCFFPKTKKGVGIRMGKGKSNVNYYLTYIKKNYTFVELFCLDYKYIKYIFQKILKKLPMDLLLVQRLFFFKKK